MRDVDRRQIPRGRQARNRLRVNVERLGRQIAGDPDGCALGAVRRTILEIIIESFVDKPADADRGIGSRHQKRSRKAASQHRSSSRWGRRRSGKVRRGLSELLNALLQQFLLGPQLDQLVGACLRKSRQQRDEGGHRDRGP